MMTTFKVPHNNAGDHHPLETAMFMEPYELKKATLKFISHEVNRESVHICWEDIFTGLRYRSDYLLLQDLLTGAIDQQSHPTLLKDGVFYVTGNFCFEEHGKHVLLTVNTIDKDVFIRAAAEIFSAFLAGTLKGRQFKQEIKLFMKELNTKSPKTGHGTGK